MFRILSLAAAIFLTILLFKFPEYLSIGNFIFYFGTSLGTSLCLNIFINIVRLEK